MTRAGLTVFAAGSSTVCETLVTKQSTDGAQARRPKVPKQRGARRRGCHKPPHPRSPVGRTRWAKKNQTHKPVASSTRPTARQNTPHKHTNKSKVFNTIDAPYARRRAHTQKFSRVSTSFRRLVVGRVHLAFILAIAKNKRWGAKTPAARRTTMTPNATPSLLEGSISRDKPSRDQPVYSQSFDPLASGQIALRLRTRGQRSLIADAAGVRRAQCRVSRVASMA